MSIFDRIKEAENTQGGGTIEIPSEMFLDLVDLWASCGWLMVNISEENEEEAQTAVFKIAEIYSQLGGKYGR